MKIYKNNKVKYWTPFFNDLKSFDILDIRDISLRYNKAFKFIRNIDYDPRLQYGAMKITLILGFIEDQITDLLIHLGLKSKNI